MLGAGSFGSRQASGLPAAGAGAGGAEGRHVAPGRHGTVVTAAEVEAVEQRRVVADLHPCAREVGGGRVVRKEADLERVAEHDRGRRLVDPRREVSGARRLHRCQCDERTAGQRKTEQPHPARRRNNLPTIAPGCHRRAEMGICADVLVTKMPATVPVTTARTPRPTQPARMSSVDVRAPVIGAHCDRRQSSQE